MLKFIQASITQPITVKETLTVSMNEYMPLHCLHIRWHGDHLIAVCDFFQRPERVLDLRLLSCGRSDEVENLYRLGTNQEETGLIGAAIHCPRNHPRSTLDARWLPPHPLKDEGKDLEIPLRTGCDTAALGIFNQMAAGPGWIVTSRIRSLNSVQSAASRVSEVNSNAKGGGSPYSG
jgi:hypothetical protein